MNQKVEGTITLDGLIEGRLSDEESEKHLHDWVKFVGAMGLRFSLDSSGDAFSMLPENYAVSCAKLGANPDDAIRQAVEQLIAALPEEDRPRVFSTLRSAEVRKGEEVQSVYVVNPDGSVGVESRSVDAKTVAPPEPLSAKDKLKMGLVGLLMAAVLVGILMLFPSVRQKFGEFVGAVTPIDEEKLAIDASMYKPYFTVEKKSVSRGAIVLVFKPGEDYPKDAEALQKAYDDADTLEKRLAVEALAKGYVRVELLDEEGGYIASTELRIADLAKKEAVEVRFGVPNTKKRLHEIWIRY